jgi:hypothetical protein
MHDDLPGWARERASELLARAEADALAQLRDALVAAALAEHRAQAQHPPRAPARDQPAAKAAPRAVQSDRPVDRTGHALWAYCVMRATEPAPSTPPGVAEAAVTQVESDGLVALTSRVPLAEFGAEPLRENLNDLAWLERVARAHEGVLEAALNQSTLVPLRLCTIFEAEDGVRGMLTKERENLLRALERLEGRQEWGVKLLVDRTTLESEAHSRSPDVPALEADLDTSAGGGAYMLRRRVERHVRAEADRLAGELAEDVHSRLSSSASDAVSLPPQNRDLSGHTGEMLLNGAYLIEADRVEDLKELVAELEERHRQLGARLELTGPWPPYNFVSPDGAAIA